MYNIKYWVGFIAFFLLFHFENGVMISDIPLSQLWKAPVLVVLFFFLVINLRNVPGFCKVNILYSIKQFINPQLSINARMTLEFFSKNILISLLYVFFNLTYKSRLWKLERLCFTICEYIILSSIPVMLGFVQPFSEEFDASRFGVEGMSYYTGIFASSHEAASYFAIASIVFIYKIVKKKYRSRKEKIFNYILLTISLYSLFSTYIRTGWVMFIVGFVVLIMPKKLSVKKVIKYGSMMIVFFLLLMVLYFQSETFKARILNRNVYDDTYVEKVDIAGSGRVTYWINGINLWYNGTGSEMLFGCGYDKVADNNQRITGMRIFSHNEFVDALAQNGIIGFVLLVLFYFMLYRFIRNRKDSSYYNISMSVYFMMLLYSVFQAGAPFLFSILCAMIFAMLNINYIRNEDLDGSTDV